MDKEGLALRMIIKDSLKYIQNDQRAHKPHRTEYQTIRLFVILGVLTVVFVLLIRLVQNGSAGSIGFGTVQRVPTSQIEATENKKYK